MKLTHYIYVCAAALSALLTACSDDVQSAGNAGGMGHPLLLRAGVSDGAADVHTRVVENGTEHDTHRPLTQGTKARLRIDGTWKEHAPEAVSQKTVATIGSKAAGTDDRHNVLTMDTQLYWDDYGTADPANKDYGRKSGLAVYAVAVDNYKKNGDFALPDGATGNNLASFDDWNALSWTLPADQTAGWADYDLLTSNNISGASTLKFDDVMHNTANKPHDLIVFTHAMSKVTVNLKASDGFDGNTFATDPKVSVIKPYIKGTVDVVNATTTAVDTPAPTENVALHKETTATVGYTSTFTGLIMPGNKYLSTKNILLVEADGNYYYVTAEKINEANTAVNDVFERGKNYIINVEVKKTKIVVTATVTDWVDVEAQEVSPVIDVTADVGMGDGSAAGIGAFSFYRFADESVTPPAETKTGVYSGLPALIEDGCYKEETFVTPSGTGTKQDCTFGTTLYWRDHNTHYHFRGVYPRTKTAGTDAPLVKQDANGVQCIEVWNCKYVSAESSFPSNLLIGAPEIASNTYCGSPYHTQEDMSLHGVCAREASINMNFRYMMSQVVVNLKTTDVSDAVRLGANTRVEIEGGYTKGFVGLHTRSIESRDDNVAYDMHNVDGNALQRHDAIVPQPLAGLKFKIYVMNEAGTAVDDVYMAEIASIPVRIQGSGGDYATITEWKSGEKYIYTLLITKTEIKMTATITDWVTKESGDIGIWF